jgi:hypothetical protein
MGSTPEKLKLASEKARRLGLMGRHKGSRNKKTIAKEKAREAFELAQLKKWEKISDAQAEEAVKNFKAREYTINQVIGKPKEIIEHEGTLRILIDDI